MRRATGADRFSTGILQRFHSSNHRESTVDSVLAMNCLIVNLRAPVGNCRRHPTKQQQPHQLIMKIAKIAALAAVAALFAASCCPSAAPAPAPAPASSK
jgi:hypothetical protein